VRPISIVTPSSPRGQHGDRVAGFTARPANCEFDLPNGFVYLTLDLQLIVARHRAAGLLDLALRLIDVPFALALVPHISLRKASEDA
jgi:hypothetical protein